MSRSRLFSSSRAATEGGGAVSMTTLMGFGPRHGAGGLTLTAARGDAHNSESESLASPLTRVEPTWSR